MSLSEMLETRPDDVGVLRMRDNNDSLETKEGFIS
jgi:hypothetical protein